MARASLDRVSVQILIGISSDSVYGDIFLGGLSSVPEDLYDAAAIEGAGGLEPVPVDHAAFAAALRQHRVRAEHDLCLQFVSDRWATTQGGPANSTDILVTYLYKLAFRLGKLGQAAAVSLIMFAILLASP